MPYPYDVHVNRGSVMSDPVRMHPAPQVLEDLTSNDLFFSGPRAIDASIRSIVPLPMVKLYAPSPYEEGSSISHVDQDTYADIRTGLMTPRDFGTGGNTIDILTLGIMEDMGDTLVPAAATTFQGSVAGDAGQSGTFTVTIQAAVSASAFGGDVRPLAEAAASGTLTLINGGGTSTLTGTFDTSTNALSLSGGGFVLTGATGQGAFSGTYTGPATTSGGFAGLESTRNAVTVMCGTYEGSNTGTGIWNLQFSASGAASGVTRPDLSARDPQPTTTGLIGQLNGTVLTLRSTAGDREDLPDGNATATGVVDGTSVSGTHDDGQGTFSGSTAGCR
jgi:hypothetical protein